MASVCSTNSNDHTGWELPSELLQIVIDQHVLTCKDLKQVRLVCRALDDFATPRLFAHVAISLIPENVGALRQIAVTPNLARHVRTIKLDNSLYKTNIDPSIYSYMAQQYFEDILGPQEEGPLSAAGLNNLLMVMPDTSIPNQYLSNPLREDFVRGYTLYHGRAQYRENFEVGSRLAQFLTEIVTPLINVTKVQLYNNWEPRASVEDLARDFKAHLIRHLSPAALQLVGGLTQGDLTMDLNSIPSHFSMYIAPGIAARNTNPMWLPPTSLSRRYSFEADALVTLFFSVLSTIRTHHVDTLELPADAYMGQNNYNLGATNYMHYTHPAIVVGRSTMNRRAPDNFLVNVFAGIKHLTLKFDALVWSRASGTRVQYNTTAIIRGIQSLQQIEQLSVSFRADQPGDHLLGQEIYTQTWSIGRLFLEGLVQLGSEEGIDGQEQGSSEEGNHDALLTNFWPSLKVLRLANMTASFGDIGVLCKTIAPSLSELELWHIRLDGSCQDCRSGALLREDHVGEASCMDWVDVVVSLRGILLLQNCNINLTAGDFRPVQKRMGWEEGGVGGWSKGEVEEVFRRWLVREVEGEGVWELMQLLRDS